MFRIRLPIPRFNPVKRGQLKRAVVLRKRGGRRRKVWR